MAEVAALAYLKKLHPMLYCHSPHMATAAMEPNMSDKEGFFTRLGRYAVYGVVLAFMEFLFGVWYSHWPMKARYISQAIVPLTGWGVIAGTLGGSFVMGIEALVGLLKRIGRGRRKP